MHTTRNHSIWTMRRRSTVMQTRCQSAPKRVELRFHLPPDNQ